MWEQNNGITIVHNHFYALISLAVITVYGLTLTGLVWKIVARVHGRVGPPIWQPFLDIIKNNAKRTAISHGIMFYLGPVFRIAGGIGTYLFIPAIYGSVVFSNLSFSRDLLLVMCFIFFGQLGMALGAGESGHPYSAIGVARGLAQMSSFEFPFTLSLISLAIQYKTLSITGIVAAQQGELFTLDNVHESFSNHNRNDHPSRYEYAQSFQCSSHTARNPNRSAHGISQLFFRNVTNQKSNFLILQNSFFL